MPYLGSSSRPPGVHLIILVLGLIMTGVAPVRAPAQETSGSLSGTVLDSSKAVIPRARVTVFHLERNAIVRELTTDNEGTFFAPRLPIGKYALIVRAPGFKTVSLESVQLDVNQHVISNIEMQPGIVKEHITVNASDPVVELAAPPGVETISGVQVRELPLNNRVYEQLVTLSPGVSSGASDELYIGTTNPTGQTNTVSFSFDGNRGNENYWTVDGADNMDRGSNSTLNTYPSVDAIAEFKILRAPYDAEFGRAAGAQINVVTRSGTRDLHVSAYEFLRNDVLAANDYFNNRNGIPRPPLRYNNFGWTIGGPLYIPKLYEHRHKTFFFFSQEFRRIRSSTTVRALVPTTAEKAGHFSAPVCTAFVNAVCILGTEIPVINPVAAQYIRDVWSKIPDPQDAITHELFVPMENLASHRQEIVRIDHTFNTSFSGFFRYLNDSIPTTEPTGAFTASVLPGVSTTETNSPGRNIMARSVWVISSRFLLDGGYAYSYSAILSKPIGLISQQQSPHVRVPLPFSSSLERIPSVNYGDAISGIKGFGPYHDYSRNHSVFATGTRATARGAVKFGAVYHHYQKTENTAGPNAGTFRFDDTGATNLKDPMVSFLQTWANFLLGNAASFQQTSADLTPDIRVNQLEAFAQQELRFRQGLNVSYGVRYSAFRQPTDAKSRLTNFDPRAYDPAAAPAIDAAGNLVPRSGDPLNGIVGPMANPRYGTKVSNENNLNLAPRIGLAWDPRDNGRTAIRAGYGMFFDSVLFGMYEQGMGVNPPLVNSLNITNTRLEEPTAEVPVTGGPPPLRATPAPFHTPYVQQWSLAAEHELGAGYIVDVGYFGSKGTHLLGFVDINQVPPGVAAAAGIPQPITSQNVALLNRLRPYRGYSYIDALESWFGSNYDSLQAKFRKVFKTGGLVDANYTWSHGLTDNQTDRNTAAQNTYDIRAEYGPTQFDRRHIFVGDFVYPITCCASHNRFLKSAFNGWQVAGIVSYSTGLPFTIIVRNQDPGGLGIIGSAQVGARPDASGDPNWGAPHQVDEWFNISVFHNVPKGQFRPGNSARGIVRGPGLARWDLALMRNVHLQERLAMQFRAEAFNVFNRANFLGLSTIVGTDFGRVISARDPRIVQLGIKLSY